MKKIILNVAVLLTISPLVLSCHSDNEKGSMKPEVPEAPSTVVEEIKDDVLYGAWSLDRADSGILINTTFKLNSDNTCEYIQEIQELNVENKDYKLVGKWCFDSKGKIIYLTFSDEDGENEITLSAVLNAKTLSSFEIDDSYSKVYDCSFKKEN